MTPEIHQQIRQFVRQTGQQAKHLRQAGLQVSEKGINDYVTDVDCLLDRLLAEQFRQWFPQDAIITEENPLSIELWQQNLNRYWFIDPIDGTSEFIAGSDSYSVMIGLLQDGEPVMGWIYAPESDRLYFGGTLIDGLFYTQADGEPQEIKFQPPTKLSFNLILSDKDEAHYGDQVRAAVPGATFYTIGSFGLKVMEVILGQADAYLYLNRRVKLWDTVGPLAIAKYVGLVYCDLDGSLFNFHPEVIHSQTLAHLQDVLIGWPKFTDQFQPALHRAFQNILIPQVSQP